MALKFRAYDKKYKSMDDVFQLDWWNDDLRVNDDTFSDYVVMQSTGLHDSTKFDDLSIKEQEDWLESGKTADDWHGKEIFQGDVLKSKDGTDGLISRFIVEKDDFYTGFIPMNREGYGFNRTMCEVIGNIYENPELLDYDLDEE